MTFVILLNQYHLSLTPSVFLMSLLSHCTVKKYPFLFLSKRLQVSQAYVSVLLTDTTTIYLNFGCSTSWDHFISPDAFKAVIKPEIRAFGALPILMSISRSMTSMLLSLYWWYSCPGTYILLLLTIKGEPVKGKSVSFSLCTRFLAFSTISSFSFNR